MKANIKTEEDLAPIPKRRRSEGVKSSRRKQLQWDQDEFRILSIDGGGIRGILPAKILAECEQRFCSGEPIGQYFDMIAGTSTGGIIALALGKDMTAAKVYDIYMSEGMNIFPARKKGYGFTELWYGIKENLKRIVKVKYDSEALKNAFKEHFQDSKYGEATRRLVIPTFDSRVEVNVLKTPHHPDFRSDWKHKMLDVALATSAAPTFLPVHRIEDEYFADGGVWANNPVMLALVDAMTCYDLDRHKVRILSLGCCSDQLKFTSGQIDAGGQWNWKDIISSAMSLASQNADGQAGLLIGRERICRLDILEHPHPIALDDYERASDELPELAVRLVDENIDQLKIFFNGKRPPYEAYCGPRLEN